MKLKAYIQALTGHLLAEDAAARSEGRTIESVVPCRWLQQRGSMPLLLKGP